MLCSRASQARGWRWQVPRKGMLRRLERTSLSEGAQDKIGKLFDDAGLLLEYTTFFREIDEWLRIIPVLLLWYYPDDPTVSKQTVLNELDRLRFAIETLSGRAKHLLMVGYHAAYLSPVDRLLEPYPGVCIYEEGFPPTKEEYDRELAEQNENTMLYRPSREGPTARESVGVRELLSRVLKATEKATARLSADERGTPSVWQPGDTRKPDDHPIEIGFVILVSQLKEIFERHTDVSATAYDHGLFYNFVLIVACDVTAEGCIDQLSDISRHIRTGISYKFE